MQDAFAQSRGTIHGISLVDGASDGHLGPVVNTEVELEGIKTDVL